MAKVKLIPIVDVNMYDYRKVVEYYKKYSCLIFTWEKIVRCDTIREELIVKVDSNQLPDKVYVNGELYIRSAR